VKNYYDILGVKKDATQAQIKKSYRNLAKRYHPDTSKETNAEELFKEVAEAYTVLGDKDKRKSYDNPAPKGFPPPGPGFGDFFSQFTGGFEDLFTSRRGYKQNPKPTNLRYRLNIDFFAAAIGKVIDLKVERMVPCKTCDGSGSTDKTVKAVCKKCHGQGNTTFLQGFFQMTRTCEECNGKGTNITNPCNSCLGKGLKNTHESIKVNIPAGVENNNVIKVKGYGHQNVKGSPPGDLFLEVRVGEHGNFKRVGNDIHTSVVISIPESILGCRREIETVAGPAKRLVIPDCTKPGDTIRLKGEGVNGGDHVVTIRVTFPRTLSKELEDAYEQVYEVTHPKG